MSFYSGHVFYRTMLHKQTAHYTNYTQRLWSLFLNAFNPKKNFIIQNKIPMCVTIERKWWRFRHCVRWKRSRHVYSVEGVSTRSVKMQQKWIKGDFSTKTNTKAQTKAESKMTNTWRWVFVQVRLVFTRRELGHGGGGKKKKKKKKSGLEMRQECISTSLSLDCKTRERQSSVPASNPTWTGAGAWEQFLGHALLSPCPLLPCCQEGETASRKGGRKRNHEVTKLCWYAPTKDIKSTWNMHTSRLSHALR